MGVVAVKTAFSEPRADVRQPDVSHPADPPPTLRRRFTTAFILALVLSFVGTVAVWSLSLLLVLKEDGLLRPANYYELQIPSVLTFAASRGSGLLSSAAQDELERVVPLEGMDYQVTDASGMPVYGTLQQPILHGPGDVTAKLNTTEMTGRRVLAYHPVADGDGHLAGTLVLSYELSLLANNRDRMLPATLFGVINAFAPFAFLTGFTWLFARRFGRHVEPDVRRLIDAAERIQNYDLDFELGESAATDELARLIDAFEQMRRALHQSLQAQWESERERQDMVAAVVHDVQTPLTAIRGLVDNLLSNESKRQERLMTYLPALQRQTDRIADLIRDMQHAVDVERSDFVLHPEPIPVPRWLQEQFAYWEPLCRERGIEPVLQVDPTSADNAPLWLDRRHLERVLANLTENSLRVTPPGGRILWDAAIRPGELTITVSDSGPGFAEHDLPRLFARFYQGDESRSGRQGRAGLGLFIVKTVVEKHGGSVHAANRPEGGAAVTVRLWEAPPPTAPGAS